MTDVHSNLVITLGKNELNSSVEGSGWQNKRKHDPTICHLQETHFRWKDINLKQKDEKICLMQTLTKRELVKLSSSLTREVRQEILLNERVIL